MKPLIDSRGIMLASVLTALEDQRSTVIDLQKFLVATPGLAPENGGTGEKDKADALRAQLTAFGFPAPFDMPAPDPRVPAGFRPNFAYRFDGQDASRTLWILAHLDVVPAGDRGLWKTDPFQLTVEGDALIGRGVEDNHQAIVSAALLGKALAACKATPPMNLGLLFLADEEVGSTFGLDHVIAHHRDLFGANDLFLVPDHGQPDGLGIEIAEKSILWLKVTVEGRQCHASRPGDGINTLRATADFIMRLHELEERFDKADPLFDPPRSTFEPTKKEANVENVNTIPGRDVFSIDCRVLPEYDMRDVRDAIEKIGAAIVDRYGVSLSYEALQCAQAAPITSPDAEIVLRLKKSLRARGRGEPQLVGVGGGTFAALLRREGYAVAAWATILENPHQPNERALISSAIEDAKTMARVLWDDKG
jgi:succinyl-diaminopimelate desuccinylase